MSTRISFFIECMRCHQNGLFATIEGAIASNWVALGVSMGIYHGLPRVSGACSTCIETGKVAV